MADRVSPQAALPAVAGGCPAGDGAAGKEISNKTAGKKTATSVPPPQTAAETAAEGATMAKTADTRTTVRGGADRPDAKKAPAKKATEAKQAAKTTAPTNARTVAETERIRSALAARRDELHQEYQQHRAEIAELQRDRLTDSAGDDQADSGSKTFEHEQELSLANSILERIHQVERAMERLDEGNYGWCERCGNAIPVERLAAFPSATLCVACKQLEERR